MQLIDWASDERGKGYGDKDRQWWPQFFQASSGRIVTCWLGITSKVTPWDRSCATYVFLRALARGLLQRRELWELWREGRADQWILSDCGGKTGHHVHTTCRGVLMLRHQRPSRDAGGFRWLWDHVAFLTFDGFDDRSCNNKQNIFLHNPKTSGST